MKETTRNKIGYILALVLAPGLQLLTHFTQWFVSMVFELKMGIRMLELYYNVEQTKAKANAKKEETRKKLFGDNSR